MISGPYYKNKINTQTNHMKLSIKQILWMILPMMDGKKVAFTQTDESLIFKVPANRPSKYAAVFEVKGVL